jgi:hypothetical protein
MQVESLFISVGSIFYLKYDFFYLNPPHNPSKGSLTPQPPQGVALIGVTVFNLTGDKLIRIRIAV